MCVWAQAVTYHFSIALTTSPTSPYGSFRKTTADSENAGKARKHFNWLNLIIQIKSSERSWTFILLNFSVRLASHAERPRSRSEWMLHDSSRSERAMLMENEWMLVFEAVRWFKMQISTVVYLARSQIASGVVGADGLRFAICIIW